MNKFQLYSAVLFTFFSIFLSCKKKPVAPVVPPPPAFFSCVSYEVNTIANKSIYFNINDNPIIKFYFSSPINHNLVNSNISFNAVLGGSINYTTSFTNNDSIVIIQPTASLNSLTNFVIKVSTALQSQAGGQLLSPIDIAFTTAIDSTDKFPQISDSTLLDLVQKQTFKYFWDFGHPISGLARERNTSGDLVTSGGSGFGIMAMVVAANRGFITRADAVIRLNTITDFLITKCQRWHGAFSHWINGVTGATIAFGNNNGADIVETSYLIEGLLSARQYFNNNTDANEIKLRDNINLIWNAVEWNWFTQNGTQKAIYWQYNPSYSASSDIWSMPVTGWNEALITYALAASSTTHPITKEVYDVGWARNGNIKNGNTFYGITLPLGQSLGGPLFFTHYSFLGINPNGLSDAYANYKTQNVAHSQINFNYCVTNPKNYNGYSSACWGLTASDIASGYTASSPTNDLGYIAPTAAISSMPYMPTPSMDALKFFYYKLGDKLFGNYGFYDAFSLNNIWFASSTLAIDQGPQIVMIENYRTGLLWNLFMSCPEVKAGMKNLGFSSPYF